MRSHDNEEQGLDRIIRSILSWDACEQAADDIDYNLLWEYLTKRETAKAEDLIREAVVYASNAFHEMYA